jgi:hypothetical protein
MTRKMHSQHARNAVGGELNLVLDLMRPDPRFTQVAGDAGAAACPCP